MDDRTLVAAMVAGDPRGLEGAYRTYADRIFTYCRGMLRDPDAAADALHDTFLLASQRAEQLREPDRLRSWLYAIARNECLRLLRRRGRQVPLAEAGEVSAPETDPVAGLRAAEIQELVWAAAEGLNPGDREVFELAVRHELPAPEVSELLGVSVAHAHARLSRARTQLERALGALLVARTGQRDCPRLAELLGDWDGRLTALVRKRVSRHIESCDACTERQRRQLRPAALFSAYAAAPFLAAPADLWPRLELASFDPATAAERTAVVERAGRFDPDTGFPRPPHLRRRRQLALGGVAAVALTALLAAGAGALIPSITPAADQPDALPTAAAAPPPAATPTGTPAAAGTGTPSLPPGAGASQSEAPDPPGESPAPVPEPQPEPPPVTDSPPPPPGSAPRIGGVSVDPRQIQQVGQRPTRCPRGEVSSTIGVTAADPEDGPDELTATFHYDLLSDPAVSGDVTMSPAGGDAFAGTLGPFQNGQVPAQGGRIEIVVTVRDPAGNRATAAPIYVALGTC